MSCYTEIHAGEFTFDLPGAAGGHRAESLDVEVPAGWPNDDGMYHEAVVLIAKERAKHEKELIKAGARNIFFSENENIQ